MTFLNYLKASLILYFWFALTACGKKAETLHPVSDPPTPTAAPTVDTKKNSLGFQLEVVALEEPNQYTVHIQIKNPLNDYFISRKTEQEAPKFVGNFLKNETRLEDKDIQSGKKYEYTFFSNENGKMEKKETLNIEIPKDLVVSATTTVPETTGFNRLFLLEGSRIQTNGESVEIAINELVSRNGVIETFPENTKAQPLSKGRSGGFISLKVNKASGNLTLFNRGEIGGDGSPGAKGSDGIKGAPGTPFILRAVNPDPLCRVAKAPYAFCYTCEQIPTSGQPGYQGAPGGMGDRGADGGNTGTLNIQIAQTSGFNLVVKNLPGKGGIGGAGGEGGEGGAGGESAVADASKVCPTPAQAPNGPKGPNGIGGANGSLGLLSPACIQIEKNATADCLRFK